jgi:hypothetical protein
MDIGSILSRAWQIIWKHKILWIFGILASCGTANASSSNFRYTRNGNIPQEFQPLVSNIPDWQIAVIVGIVILVILFLVIVSIFLSTIGHVGMIRGTFQANKGTESLSLGELFSGSLPYFWRVFALNLLVGLAFALAIIIVTVPLAISVIGIPCLIPLICLLIPIGWIINILLEQADIAIVLENLGIVAGFQRGWEIVKNNLGNVIVMGLILVLGISLIGGLILGLPLFLIAGPAVLGIISGNRAAFGGLALSALCLVAYLPILIVLNGILIGYVKAAWTLTYLELTAPPAPAAETISVPA